MLQGSPLTFVSEAFAVFLLGVLIVYFLAPKRGRWVVLLVGSVAFCSGGGLTTLIFAVLATAVTFCGALAIERTEITDKRKRRLFLTVTATFLVGVLALVKCAARFSWGPSWFLLPIGVSYYTFSAMSYLADVYWGKDSAERNIAKFALFMLYFPKFLQGPISRHKHLGAQLVEGHDFSYDRMLLGLQLILWGCFKKLVIADRIAILTSAAIPAYSSLGGGALIAVFSLAAVQLYCDFSGCMDIAQGVSQILGIELEQNFNHPFFSRSAPEFWRRWHITLGAWFKDYVYMPLAISPRVMKIAGWVRKRAGKQAGKAVVTIIPLTVVWLLTGLWHGTGWNYIVWGMWWGSLIIASTLLSKRFVRIDARLGINTSSCAWRVFQMARTFGIFVVGRMITVPNDLLVTARIFKRVVFDFDIGQLFDGTLLSFGLGELDFAVLATSVLLLWVVGMTQERRPVRELIAGWNVVLRSAFWAMAVVAVLLFGAFGSGYEGVNASFAYMFF